MSYNKVAFVTSKDSDQTAHLSAVLPETPPVTMLSHPIMEVTSITEP